MSNPAPVTFDPVGSIQDNLETKVTTRLTDEFPTLASNPSLIRWCGEVQAFALELIKAMIFEELQLRFKNEFVTKPLNEFKLKGIRYRQYVDLVNAFGEGEIAYRIQRTDQSGDRQKFHKKTKRWELSLTANIVQASMETSLEQFLPVAIDIIFRVIRAMNGWLEERLVALNRQSGSVALHVIRNLFTEHFGDYANDMLIYPYINTSDGFVGAYIMDDQLFGSVVDRIKRSASNQVPRSQQLASLLETSMGIELTESRKALQNRTAQVVPLLGNDRLYESKHGEYHRAEDAIFNQDVITHPLVFCDEINDLQLVVCYPIRISEVEGGRIPREIEALRGEIVKILKNYDLSAPILRLARLLRNTHPVGPDTLAQQGESVEQIKIEDLRIELQQILQLFLHWNPPTGDRADVIMRVVDLSGRIQECTVVDRLRRVKLRSLGGPSLMKLEIMEQILNET